jgi:transketolase
MAIAGRWLAARYNRPGFEVFDYAVYAVCGDGCLMEGVGSEAASLGGHLGLDNLCWVYDNNHITIEGSTKISFTEDVAARFLGYGWNVLRVGDANDLERIDHTLGVFRATRGRPTLVILDSHIGYGSPHRQDTAAAHGEPSVRRRSGSSSAPTAGPRTPGSWCPRPFAHISARASGRAARRRAANGRKFSHTTDRSTRGL